MGNLKVCESLQGPLPNFKPILENWCKIVVSWCERNEWEDVPWWYGERSSLGLFALAAWEVGAAPLEEYSTEKGMGRGRWTGRGDLLISITEKDYIIEAKQKWISISSRATKGKIKLDDTVLYVRDEVRHSTEFRGKRAGLVFAVPYLPKSEKEFIDERIGEFVDMLRNRDDRAVAWVFPEEARNKFLGDDGYLYPGIAVLIRPLRKP
jgi:hypothetical protein